MFYGLLQRLADMTGKSTSLQEILYGFIMALIFVNASALGLLNFDDPIQFVWMVTGMNVTWGAIDAVIFYYLGVCDQNRFARIIRNSDNRTREERVNDLMDEFSASPLDILEPEEQRKICENILDHKIQTEDESKKDRKAMALSSLGCFIWTVLTLIPIVVPVILIDDFRVALFVALTLSSIILFLVGFYMARYLGTDRWKTGLALAVMSWIIAIISTFTGG